jgi:DNA-directed RNA polymerase subunit E'/Rpb7
MTELITTTISIPIDKLKHKNVDGIILYKLKTLCGNRCSTHGLIEKDTIEIINRSIGKISHVNNESSITYDITYRCQVINPCKGDEYECYINSITKMGIIAYIKKDDKDTIETSPLLIIVPQDYINDTFDIKPSDINKKIKIRILDTRSKYKSEQIQIVAELLTIL